jgi:hypothetical protein
MSAQDWPDDAETSIAGAGSRPRLSDISARAQQLVDAPRSTTGYPLEWQVQATHLGDLQALAVLALRSRPR